MKFRELLKKINELGIEVTARSISNYFGVTLPHAHQDLKRLYNMEFISRRKDPKDRRRYLYWINKKGRSYLGYLEAKYLMNSRILYKLYVTMRPEELSDEASRTLGKMLKDKLIGDLACDVVEFMVPGWEESFKKWK